MKQKQYIISKFESFSLIFKSSFTYRFGYSDCEYFKTFDELVYYFKCNPKYPIFSNKLTKTDDLLNDNEIVVLQDIHDNYKDLV